MDAKACTKCKEEKLMECFSKQAKMADGHMTWCKSCVSAYDKKRFQDNYAEEKQRLKEKAQRYRDVHSKFIYEYLLEHPCETCPEKDPVALEFDHIDPETKRFNVSEMIHQCGLETIKKEIAKCRVLCANCHRKKTARDRNYLRLQYSDSIGV